MIFLKQVADAGIANNTRRGTVDDWYAFTVAFKGVLLEGLEVAFIVVTIGVNQHNMPLASLSAVAAIVAVVGAGVAVQRPLSRVPENTLKLAVGVMLTSFGMFWGSEGAGIDWPGSDAALLGLIAFTAAFALTSTTILRRRLATPTSASLRAA